jgi:hypothetical protein
MYGNANSETLGAHLRNLLTPYKNLIQLNKDGLTSKKFLEDCEDNLLMLIEFSNLPEMENTIFQK